MTQLRKRMLEELQRRDYSQSTGRIYLHVIASISVGSGGGVWGIDSTGQVYAFSTP